MKTADDGERLTSKVEAPWGFGNVEEPVSHGAFPSWSGKCCREIYYRTPLPPIGFGLPLTIDIRHVYTGRFGYSSRLSGMGDIAVISGVKNWGGIPASTRFLNIVSLTTGSFSDIKVPSALSDGTPIVVHQRSVMTLQVTVTVELHAKLHILRRLDWISDGFSTLLRAPLLLPFANYALTAGRILLIFSKVIKLFYERKNIWRQTFQLNFGLPGTLPSTAEFRLLSADPKAHEHYSYVPDVGLINANGLQYHGHEPYVIVAIYGGDQPESGSLPLNSEVVDHK